MAYLPDPFHFDRFWVGALCRRSEALLHLSWNEWWEGSNLEPCREFGKTYCEKNLFYSTLMKLAFDSIRKADEDAATAVLLNDWRFASGGPHAEELYGTCDYISLHIPANDKTKKSINYDLLSKTKKGATLVNTARKEVIDEDGLLKLMGERSDFGYASDLTPDCLDELNEFV